MTFGQFCKNTILTHCCTICVSKHAQKTIKMWKTVNKHLDQFLTCSLDQFLTHKRPNLGPVFSSTAYTYIYIYAVKLKSDPIFALFKVKKWSFLFFCFRKSRSPCRKKRIFENKKNNKNTIFKVKKVVQLCCAT